MEIYIYKIQNKLNGMCYIGLTNDPRRRWAEHINGKTNSLIHNAIKKYGEKNFTFTILERGISNYRLAAEREKYYIQVFNSYEKGYNCSLGGETPVSKPNNLKLTPLTQAQKERRKRLKQNQQKAKRKINKIRNKK